MVTDQLKIYKTCQCICWLFAAHRKVIAGTFQKTEATVKWLQLKITKGDILLCWYEEFYFKYGWNFMLISMFCCRQAEPLDTRGIMPPLCWLITDTVKPPFNPSSLDGLVDSCMQQKNLGKHLLLLGRWGIYGSKEWWKQKVIKYWIQTLLPWLFR